MFCLFSFLQRFKMKSASLSKQRQVVKTWSVKDLVIEYALFQVDACEKQEIHSVPCGHMLNLVSNANNILDNRHRLGLKLHCHIL